MDFWDVPGPRGFINDVIDAVLDGKAVFVHLPANCPAGLEYALETRLGLHESILEPASPLSERLLLEVSEVDRAEAPRIDAQFLAERLGGRSFVIDCSVQERALILEGELLAFANIARTQAHGERPMFLVFLRGKAASRVRKTKSTTVAHLSWDGYVSGIDMLLYTIYTLRAGNNWRDRLKARIISELACYDPAVVDALAACDPDSVSQVSRALHELAISRGWTAGPPVWGDGAVASVNGINEFHSAHPSFAGLQYRIWRAQVAELFPVLETRRQDIVRRYESLLTLPTDHDRFIETVRDLEFGHVFYQLRDMRGMISIDELSRLRRWRDIRNSLAHGEVVEISRLDDDLFLSQSENLADAS